MDLLAVQNSFVMENEMTWELYGRMKEHKKTLIRLSNQVPKKFVNEDDRKKAQDFRFKVINEIASVSKWLRDAESKLSFIVTGDAEFSNMAKSKYFNLLPYDPEEQRKVLDWVDYIQKARDPKTRWLMIKADPEKHRILNERRRYNAHIKRKN